MFVLVAFHHWRVNTMTFTTKLQDKFLDIDYVEEILKRNKYIKSGKVKFEIEKSNRYNITQTLAETFGVYCRYEYEYDEKLLRDRSG